MDRYQSNNKLLQLDSNPFEYQTMYLAPALFLNGILVREELNPVMFTTAVCSKLSSKPDICKEVVQNLKWKDNYINMARLGISEFIIFIVVLAILLICVYLLIKFIA